jgi:type II secretory pathway pseudopilin PulG
MLVVITIIGILAALLIPAIYAAVTKARTAAIAADINQLEMAVESYKNLHTDYPPNFFEDYTSTAWTSTVLSRHLKRVSRNASENMTLWTFAGNAAMNPLLGSPDATSANPTQIDAAETLVFWLAGLSKSAGSPVTGPMGPLQGVPSTTDVVLRPIRERENAFFEFNEARLIDLDADGLPEYVPPHGERVPYVYFDGRSYDNLSDANGNGFADDASSDDSWAFYPPTPSLMGQYGAVRPYVIGARAGTDGSGNAIVLPVYANEKKFQIICAGMDGLYGQPGGAEFLNLRSRKVYLTEQTQAATQFGDAVQYEKQDLDNLTNFSGGALENQMP